MNIWNNTDRFIIPGFLSNNSWRRGQISGLSDSMSVSDSNLINIECSLVPTLTISSTELFGHFSALYPARNTIPLKVRTEDFSLSANLTGRWKLPDDTLRSVQSISYVTLRFQYFGLYQYLINNWDGDEVVAIQITLIPDGNLKLAMAKNNVTYCHFHIGFVVTDPVSISNTPIQNNSIIIATQDRSMIDCAVSSLSDNVQWTFKSQTNGTITDITSLATISEETGFSTLVVTSNESGYYSCIINTHSVHTFSVVYENSIGKSDYWNFSNQYAVDNIVYL